MARKHKFVSKPAALKVAPDIAPRELSKAEFGRRLNQILLDREWTQSDLARQAFGTTTNSNGYKVAKNRETISSIISGRAAPSPLTLTKIARALGMAPEELYPNARRMAIANDADPEMEFKIAAGHPNTGWLKINRLVSYDAFVQIASILQADQRDMANERPPRP